MSLATTSKSLSLGSVLTGLLSSITTGTCVPHLQPQVLLCPHLPLQQDHIPLTPEPQEEKSIIKTHKKSPYNNCGIQILATLDFIIAV